MSTAIGLDLGGSKILAVLLRNGTVVRAHEIPTPQSGYHDVLTALVAAARAVHEHPLPVGLCAPGPFDYEAGTITFSPNIAGLAGEPLIADLQTALGAPVLLENDANAAAYAEHRLGAAAGLSSSVFITVSTGIGAGIIIGDHIVRGAHGLAGEIGHMTLLPGAAMGTDGHAGTFETLASGRALARDATYIYSRPVTTAELFALAAENDELAERVTTHAADHLGLGVANLVKIIDPERFVFGGSVVMKNPWFFAQVAERARWHARGFAEPRLVYAALGSQAGAIGAGMLALSPAAVYGIGERTL